MIEMFYDTFIQSLIFDKNPSSLLRMYENLIFSEEFIDNLENYIEFISSNDLLEKEQTNNLLIIINYIRLNAIYENIDEKKSYYERFNKMIEKINLMKHESSLEYYTYQINIRMYFIQNTLMNIINNKFNTSFCFRRNISYEKYLEQKEIIKEVMKRDFMVFCYILDLEEIDITEEMEENLKANPYYTALSLSFIISSMENILSIDIVKERIKKIYSNKVYKK